MDPNPNAPAGRPPLNGWKEIAAYLGKSVRSAQRWEMTLGLPVRRINTPDGHIVYADADEIDDWRRQFESSPAPHADEHPEDDCAELQQPSNDVRPVDADPSGPASTIAARPEAAVTAGMGRRTTLTRMAAFGALLFLCGAASGWWFAQPAQLAVQISYVGRSIEAIGRDGVIVWTYQFESDISAPARMPTFVDLDGDGESEVLVPVRRGSRGAGTATSDALFCFSRSGRLMWSVAPDHTLSFGGRSYSAPWELRDFVVATTAPPRAVWIAYAHHTWFPGLVLQVNARGDQFLRYVQSGPLYSLAHWMTPAGGFIAVGGGSNEHARATIALIPDSGPASTFPSGNPKFFCERCPSAAPSRILLVAAAELTLANHELLPYVQALRVAGASLKATIADGPGRSVAMVNPDFSIDSIQFGQRYWAAHRDLELKGRLNHSMGECPDRAKRREIQEWTAETGWRSWTVMPAIDDY